MWWHRDLAPAHTSRASANWRYDHATHALHRACPARQARVATVRLQGWVHRRRELAALTFLVVRDRTGLAQVVVAAAGGDVPPEETTVEVVGTATANPQAPGGVEVTDPVITPAHRAGGHAAGRAVAARRSTPGCRRCSTTRP